MAQAGTDELKVFVFTSLRGRLALDMLLLCLRRNVKLVSVADFATHLKAKQADVARVMIDWSRQGLFRPSTSGKYCLAIGAGQVPILQGLLKACAYEQGTKDLTRWVEAIEKKLVASPDELPDLAPPPEPPKAPAAVRAAAPAKAPATPPAKAAPQQAQEPVSSDNLDAETIKAIRRYVAAIPPLPIVAQQLLKEISSPQSSAKSLASIAIKDPAIVLSLLRMANSAYYAQGEEVVDVQRAIVVIGLNNIRHLLMASGLQNVFRQPKGARGYSFEDLWSHALGVSVAARLLTRKAPIMGEAEAGTIGLLHDIGKFAMAVAHPKLTEELLDPFQGPEGLTGIAKEVVLFGSTHAIYGMMLLESWKLPNDFARIIEYHHHPAYAVQQRLPPDILRGLALVHIANQLAKLGGLECGDREIEPVPAFCYETLGLQPNLELLLDERMRHTFEQVKFFVSGGSKPAGAAAGQAGNKGGANPAGKPAPRTKP